MKLNRTSLLFALLLGSATPLICAQQNKPADATTQPKVGDRLPPSKAPATSAGFKEITWEALMPKNSNPAQQLKGLNLAQMNDNDPRAMEALERMRKAWNEAPVEPSMNGARVKIPGFLIPLDVQRGQVKEFLLVPYFGACIHTPPPPANQIIHAVAAKPLKDVKMMDTVWISGTLETVRTDTDFGTSGYRMNVELVAPYKR